MQLTAKITLSLTTFIFAVLTAFPTLSWAKLNGDCNLNTDGGCGLPAESKTDLNGNQPNSVIGGFNNLAAAIDFSKKSTTATTTQAWLSPALTPALSSQPYPSLVEESRGNSFDQESEK